MATEPFWRYGTSTTSGPPWRSLPPDCEWRSELSELVGGGECWVGRHEIARFHKEFFELIQDSRVEIMRFLQVAEDVFLTRSH
jgi:hypothetical protein